MKITNIYQAKTNLSQLIDKSLAGEQVIIGKYGKPVAQIIPYEPVAQQRIPGFLKGAITVSESFDEVDTEIEKQFYGE